MAAVSTVPMPTATHTSEKDASSAQSPSGFTAVNGPDSAPNGANIKSDSPQSTESTINVAGAWPSVRVSPRPSSRQPTPPPRPVESGPDETNGSPRESRPPTSHNSSPGAHKRKRSQSEEDENSSSSNSRYNLSPSRSNDPDPQHGHHDRYYGSAPPDGAARHNGHEEDGRRHPSQYSLGPNGTNGVNGHGSSHASPWHDRNHALPPGYHPNGHRLDSSDAQLAEALQRESHEQDTPIRTWHVPTRSEADSENGEGYGPYSQDGTPTGSGQPNPKRKRVFSNRTKTGCLTCRRRKKKCDEQHPQCNNCLRGGFQCEGYNSRSTWQKPSNIKTPIPLQSKDGYPDMADQGYRIDDTSPRQGRSSLNREGVQTRPIVVDDGDHPHHAQLTASPTSAGPRSRGSWPGQPWPNPSNLPYLPERGPSKQGHLPPFSEIARGDANKPEYRAMPPMRDMSHPIHNGTQPPPNPPHPAQTGQYAYGPPPADYRQSYQYPAHQQSSQQQPPQQLQPSQQQPPQPQPPQQADPNNFQNTARMALSSIEQTQPPPRVSMGGGPVPEDSERSKMIKGKPFRFGDPDLVADRKRCKAALARFHYNITSQADDISSQADELAAQALKWVFSHPENQPYRDRPIGSIGADTVIEPQFNCHYGYNIKLGDKVYIGKNCTIIDASTVTIGSLTTIADNVTIIAGEVGKGLFDRQGSTAIWQGSPITIGKEVSIGAGSFIYPGVRLGEACTVQPGTHVKNNVAKGQTVGQPAGGVIIEDPLAGLAPGPVQRQ